MLKSFSFWCSIFCGTIIFFATFPYNHDMYIAPIFTVICTAFNLFSSSLLSYTFWQLLTKKKVDGTLIYFWVIQMIFHIPFAMMSYGSWIFIGLALLLFIVIIIRKVQSRYADS